MFLNKKGITQTVAAIIVVVIVIAGVGGGLGVYYTTQKPAAPTPEPEPTPTPEPEPTPTPEPAPTTEPFKIGVTLPLTGPLAYIGDLFYKGASLAVDHYNDEGGILGQPIELIVYDDGFDPDSVSRLTEQLIVEDEVDILLSAIELQFMTTVVAEKYDKVVVGWFECDPTYHEAFGELSWEYLPTRNIRCIIWI